MMIDVFNKLHCLKNNKLLIINSFPSVVSPGGVLAFSVRLVCACATPRTLLLSKGLASVACGAQLLPR